MLSPVSFSAATRLAYDMYLHAYVRLSHFFYFCLRYSIRFVSVRPFLTRNIFDKYLVCLGPKKLSKIFLENIIWEMWEASYGSEIFFSLFDGGM